MSDVFERRIGRLAASESRDCLHDGLKGVEKESLRVGSDGLLSMGDHPRALGSALTNRFITTDFSEALLEFVTPAYVNTWETLRVLCDIHQFTYSRIDEEFLWAASMPCALPADSRIPLARYGDSNVGRMKTVYRKGLGYRYGRNMQTIAGIHFNYSLPDRFWPIYHQLEGDSASIDAFRSDAYFGLVRNFRRMGWIVLYLFGASPALCKTFSGEIDMPSLDENTFYEPFGTSLRMSDLGYNSNTQSSINISLNSLDEYINDLNAAIATPVPSYEAIGVVVDGEYRQLSANQLQIENEYYSPIRPKRVAQSGERPTTALRHGGVEYIEVRSLDLNLFDPVGISQNTMRFVEAFAIYCLLEESPPFDKASYAEATENHKATATRGREPAFMLMRNAAATPLKEWAGEILDKVAQVAELIDAGSGSSDYLDAVDAQRSLVEDASLTPSARILRDLQDQDMAFFHYAFEAAKNHKRYFSSLAPMQPDRLKALEEESLQSLQRQSDIEAENDVSFDEYLERFFAS